MISSAVGAALLDFQCDCKDANKTTHTLINLHFLFFPTKNGNALSAGKGATAERAFRLQERSSSIKTQQFTLQALAAVHLPGLRLACHSDSSFRVLAAGPASLCNPLAR